MLCIFIIIYGLRSSVSGCCVCIYHQNKTPKKTKREVTRVEKENEEMVMMFGKIKEKINKRICFFSKQQG